MICLLYITNKHFSFYCIYEYENYMYKVTNICFILFMDSENQCYFNRLSLRYYESFINIFNMFLFLPFACYFFILFLNIDFDFVVCVLFVLVI